MLLADPFGPRTRACTLSRLPRSSYAVVCQFVVLELLRRGVHVTFRDTELYNPQWQRLTGLFPAEQEDLLQGLAPPASGDPPPDATFRFSFPFNLTAAAGPGPTILHGTTEHGAMVPAQLLDSPLNARSISVGRRCAALCMPLAVPPLWPHATDPPAWSLGTRRAL